MKKISDQSVRDTYTKKNKEKNQQEVAAAILDQDLFTVNASKDGLKKERAKLAADRFKRKGLDERLRSKTEIALKKKLAKKGPPEPQKEVKEVFDVWATSSACDSARALVVPSKRTQKFKDFSNRSMTKVKSVIKPMEG